MARTGRTRPPVHTGWNTGYEWRRLLFTENRRGYTGYECPCERERDLFNGNETGATGNEPVAGRVAGTVAYPEGRAQVARAPLYINHTFIRCKHERIYRL